jgi:hypothetical protein
MTSPCPIEGKGVIEVHALVLLGHRGKRLLYFCPFCHKICERLRLDCRLWAIHYVKPHEFENPLGDPSRGEAIPNNFSKLV